MKILITGARGTLGQYLARVLSDQDLILWDRDDLDISNQEKVNVKIFQVNPDVIINCVAYNNVDGAESNIEMANLVNGYAVGYLAQVAKKINALMIHFSSNYVFSGDDVSDYLESDQPNPQNVYARSKVLGEQELQKNTDRYYLIRTARLFGLPGSGETSKKSFIDLIIETAIKNDYKIKGITEEYDFPTYAFDLSQRVKALMEDEPDYGIYHICNSGKPCTWHGYASEIFRIKNMDVEMEEVSGDAFGVRPAKRPMYANLGSTKLKSLRNWQEALEEFLGQS